MSLKSRGYCNVRCSKESNVAGESDGEILTIRPRVLTVFLEAGVSSPQATIKKRRGCGAFCVIPDTFSCCSSLASITGIKLERLFRPNDVEKGW
jgi:hypothetical protein